jgi:hypothetical protein
MSKRGEALAGALLIVILLAIAPAASASPWDRNCAGGGAVGPEDSSYNFQYFFDQIHVAMNPGEAIRLARQQPPEEFGYRATPQQTVCIVGAGIASSAASRWVHWSGNSGWVNAHSDTSGGSAYIGLYRCIGIAGNDSTWVRERCTTQFAGGNVTGSFRIRVNPQYAGA